MLGCHFVGYRLLGEAAVSSLRQGHNAGSDTEIRHRCTDLGDDAGNLESGCERHRRLHLILPLDDQVVREVHAGGPNPDSDLTGLKRPGGEFTDDQAFRRPVSVTDRCQHYSPFPRNAYEG